MCATGQNPDWSREGEGGKGVCFPKVFVFHTSHLRTFSQQEQHCPTRGKKQIPRWAQQREGCQGSRWMKNIREKNLPFISCFKNYELRVFPCENIEGWTAWEGFQLVVGDLLIQKDTDTEKINFYSIIPLKIYLNSCLQGNSLRAWHFPGKHLEGERHL